CARGPARSGVPTMAARFSLGSRRLCPRHDRRALATQLGRHAHVGHLGRERRAAWPVAWARPQPRTRRALPRDLPRGPHGLATAFRYGETALATRGAQARGHIPRW